MDVSEVLLSRAWDSSCRGSERDPTNSIPKTGDDQIVRDNDQCGLSHYVACALESMVTL